MLSTMELTLQRPLGGYIRLFFFFNICLFIWLQQFLVVAGGIFLVAACEPLVVVYGI